MTDRQEQIEKYRETGECLCTFAQKMVGDGCWLCNPYEVMERMEEQIDELEKTVEGLESALGLL